MKKLFTKYESGLLIKLIENTRSNQYVMVDDQLTRDVSACVESLEEAIRSLKEVDDGKMIEMMFESYELIVEEIVKAIKQNTEEVICIATNK